MKKHEHNYTNESLAKSKQLRSDMTIFEQKLWYYLRAKRFFNLKYKRQVPIGKYIVDFACKDKMYIIELDGSGHLEKKQTEHDMIRDEYLKNQGYSILRIYNNDINNNIETVLQKIKDELL